eukprot:Gb_28717 [translate_table: standard]
MFNSSIDFDSEKWMNSEHQKHEVWEVTPSYLSNTVITAIPWSSQINRSPDSEINIGIRIKFQNLTCSVMGNTNSEWRKSSQLLFRECRYPSQAVRPSSTLSSFCFSFIYEVQIIILDWKCVFHGILLYIIEDTIVHIERKISHRVVLKISESQSDLEFIGTLVKTITISSRPDRNSSKYPTGLALPPLSKLISLVAQNQRWIKDSNLL